MRAALLTGLLLLSQTAHVSATNEQYYLGKQKEKDDARKHQDEASIDTDVATAPQSEPVVRQPGFELVDSAMKELEGISKRSPARSGKQTSIFSKAFLYIMKALPSGPALPPSQTHSHSKSVPSQLHDVLDNLHLAAKQNNSDALYILAELNFFGNYSHPRNLHTAFDYYQELASNHGNTTAQYMLGLFYSTGIGNVVPRDQARALLYYTFAALQGDVRAEMATAFRHHSGIGAHKSCETAVKYYKRVADKVIQWYRSGPPGGMSWVSQGWRIADQDGGVYGKGASVSSSGVNAYTPSINSDANAAIGDVIEYLDLMSQKGDFKASFNLGRIYYDGQRGLERDVELARRYFFLVASKYWRRDGKLVDNFKPGIEKTASKAAGYIGWMYLRGDGMPQNFDRAYVWFNRGITLGEARSQYGLGLLYLEGLGRGKNVKRAMDLFRASAESDFAPALVQMGRLYLDQGGAEDVRIASNYFELAVRHGDIEAAYYLAEMTYTGVGRERLCGQAMSYYKSVVERAEPLTSSWTDANDAYEAGDYGLAFLEYLMAAEQGYEKAQTNVAFIIDSEQSSLPILKWLDNDDEKEGFLEDPALALIYWTRSSRQNNVDALVKMGDYYYHGIGTERDLTKAVSCYTGASDYSQSAQALFNLGWMHENGIGLTQDFHLAKRYYDHALEVSDEAYLPVTLSLLKLRARSAWNTLTNGGVHSIQEEPKQSKDWSLTDWVANFLQDYGIQDNDWYAAEDTLYDDTIGAGDDDDAFGDDGGVLESLMIISITMSLVFLLWWRQRMQQAHAEREAARRREQGLPPQQAQQPAANGANNFLNDFWHGGGVAL